MANFELIKSDRGNNLLNSNNFLFECDKKYTNVNNQGIIYWKCTEFRRQNVLQEQKHVMVN